MSILSSIQDSIQTIKGDNNVSILTCRISSVNIESLTVDVHIIEESSALNNVPICFPSKGAGFGSYFMPSEGSIYLLVRTSRGKYYVLAHAPIFSLSNDGERRQTEKLLGGENLIQSLGGGFLKQDLRGNNLLFSSFGNGFLSRQDGVNSSYSNGREDVTISSKKIEGFKISSINDRPSQDSDTKRLVNYSEFCSSVKYPRVYAPEEILELEGGEYVISENIKSVITSNTKSIINKIEEINNVVNSVAKDFIETSSSEADFLDSVKNQLTSFNIEQKGVKVIIEKGNATKNEIGDISDVSNLKESDFEKSEQGHDICLRLTVKDIESNEVKASASIDVEGNCKLKFKSLTIDVEDDTIWL